MDSRIWLKFLRDGHRTAQNLLHLGHAENKNSAHQESFKHYTTADPDNSTQVSVILGSQTESGPQTVKSCSCIPLSKKTQMYLHKFKNDDFMVSCK